MKVLAILLLSATMAVAAPPKGERIPVLPTPVQAKAAPAPQIVFVREMTLIERIRDRRMQRLGALQSMSFGRPLLGMFGGGCCQK